MNPVTCVLPAGAVRTGPAPPKPPPSAGRSALRSSLRHASPGGGRLPRGRVQRTQASKPAAPGGESSPADRMGQPIIWGGGPLLLPHPGMALAAVVILAAEPSLAANKAIDPASGTGKEAYRQELCQTIYDRRVSSGPQPADYCKYLSESGIPLVSLSAPAPSSAASPAAASPPAVLGGGGSSSIPLGAIFGAVGLGAAGISYSATTKLRDELEVAREDIQALRQDVEALREATKGGAAAVKAVAAPPLPAPSKVEALEEEVVAPQEEKTAAPKVESAAEEVVKEAEEVVKDAPAPAAAPAIAIEVPADIFGSLTPEGKAAVALRNLVTFVAVRSVMAQEEGFDGSGQSGVYKGLTEAVQTPITSSEEWIGRLMTDDEAEMQAVAVRILDIRQQYTEGQFDWRTTKKMVGEGLRAERAKLCQWYRIKGAEDVLAGVSAVGVEDEVLTPAGAKRDGKFWIDIDTVAFGGVSPERKAADALRNLFTYVAVRSLMAQEGEGRVHGVLVEAVEKGLGSSEKFIGGLMKKEGDAELNMAGVKILAIREQYAEGVFDWKVLATTAAAGAAGEKGRLCEEYPAAVAAARAEEAEKAEKIAAAKTVAITAALEEAAAPKVESAAEEVVKEAEEVVKDAPAPAAAPAIAIEVPADIFGSLTPEGKAAVALRNLVTFVAVRSVMAQEEGFDGSGQSGVYKGLTEAVQTPITSSEEWIGRLMTDDEAEMQAVAVRILDIRQQYTEGQFDWRTTKKMVGEGLRAERAKLCQWYRIKGAEDVLAGVSAVGVEDEVLTPAGAKREGKFWIDIDTVAFGGVSPERKAADALRNLFTYVAVRSLMAQEGEGRVHGVLVEAVEKGLGSSEKFIGGLMKKEGDAELNMAGVKILAIREQYAEGVFDWKVLATTAAAGAAGEKGRLCEEYPAAVAAARAEEAEKGDKQVVVEEEDDGEQGFKGAVAGVLEVAKAEVNA